MSFFVSAGWARRSERVEKLRTLGVPTDPGRRNRVGMVPAKSPFFPGKGRFCGKVRAGRPSGPARYSIWIPFPARRFRTFFCKSLRHTDMISHLNTPPKGHFNPLLSFQIRALTGSGLEDDAFHETAAATLQAVLLEGVLPRPG